ncbi:adhesive plaque matrix protein 2-like [Mytilus edulis]|uniref:adhesive plaque matrix protein 2-like n=1 Tax=Mytilus edulis TaxID=6550 RepID=UPI0039F1239D
MDMSPTKTTVSKNTSLIWKIAAVFFLCTTVIFVSLFIWSELKGDTDSGIQVTPCFRSQCENDGICSVIGNNFSCNCLNSYSGSHCETLEPP